jgi:hypothetical protein
MAESILLHFGSASATDVLSHIAALSEKLSDQEWYFFPTNTDYLLSITIYSDYKTEYEDQEQNQIKLMLGSEPSCSLDFELRRSKSSAACDAALEFIRKLIIKFRFVVDDCFQFWHPHEAIDAAHFLKQYRY